MSRSAIFVLAAFAAFVCASDSLHANSGTAPTNRTGAPGHSSCVQCHTGPAGNGSVGISFSGGVSYQPGDTYELMVAVEEIGKLRFGFSMVARDTDNDRIDVGTWSERDPNAIVNGPGGSHVGHFSAPFGSDSHVFTVSWTAPDPGVGEVTFYAVGNAANGNGRNGPGDSIYTTSLTIDETVDLPNQAPSLTVPGPVALTSGFARPIEGVAVDDEDAREGILSLELSVSNGTLVVHDAVPGGVAPDGITGNGSEVVELEGTVAELNSTLSAADGLLYKSDDGYVGPEKLDLLVNDNGNTGSGGEMTGVAEVQIMVNPPPTLGSFARQSDGVFNLTLRGGAGQTYTIEFSDDGNQFQDLEEITLDQEFAQLSDPTAANSSFRIYRAREKID